MMRKIAALLCALTLISFSALAETHYCVATDKNVLLVFESGEAIDLSSAWSDIYCIREDALYAVGLARDGRMRYALCDVNGRLLTEPVYASLSAAQGGVLFQIDGVYGWMDESGKEEIPADYTQLVPAGDGAFYAFLTNPNDDQADQIYCVDVSGASVSSGVWTTIPLSEPSDSRMPFCEQGTALYGYLDSNGAIAIAPQFEYAGKFSGGLANAVQNGKHGLIDTSGEWVLQPEYSYIAEGESFYVALKDHSACIVFDADGRTELFRLDEANLEVAAVGGAIVAVNAESLRIYDRTGTLRRTCAPNAAVVEGARGQLILSEGDWGSQTVRIIDESGAKIDRVDQHLIPLDDERYAFVSMNVALYNSDILGGTRYSVNYDSLRVGMIDRTGREIVPAEYEEIRAVGKNRYLLIGERALILCNEEGKTIWQKKL